MRRCRWLLAGFACATLLHPAAAREPFEGTFTIDGATSAATAQDIERFVDLFTNNGLRSLSATYTTNSAATADISLRGVPATLSYQQNLTALRLQVPSAGIDERFTGATRDESQDQALEYLKGRGGAALTRLLQQAVATTPIDPIAGNPTSLMSQMGASDFGVATGGAAPRGLSFGLGARFGSFSADGYDTKSYTLPLGYSWGLGGGQTLVLDTPLTMLSTSGAQSYAGSAGLGIRVPVRLGLADVDWALTPMLRIGGAGSTELGAAGGIASGSVTSVVDWRLAAGTTLTIGNMVSWLRTLPIHAGDVDVSYELTNIMFRNGLILQQSVGEWFGRPVRVAGFAIDTRFTGDALYIRNYREFGGFLTFGAQPGTRALPVSLGVTVLNGEHGYRGFSLNLGMTF